MSERGESVAAELAARREALEKSGGLDRVQRMTDTNAEVVVERAGGARPSKYLSF